MVTTLKKPSRKFIVISSTIVRQLHQRHGPDAVQLPFSAAEELPVGGSRGERWFP